VYSFYVGSMQDGETLNGMSSIAARAVQLIFLFVIACLGLAAQERVGHATFDLRAKGYLDLPNDFKYLQFQLMNGQIAFVDPDRVAVSFLIANKNFGLTDRERLSGGKWLFQTLVINVNSGQLQNEWAWRTASPDSQFIPLPTGQFFVSSDERMTLQQPDGRTLWRLDLPKTDVYPARPYGTAIVSDTGNTLFVVSDKDKATETVDVYSTSDIKAKYTFAIPIQSLTSFLPATDSGLLYTDPRPNVTFVDRSGLHSHIVWTCQIPWQCALHPHFIGTKRLLLNDGLHTLLLLDDQGALLRKREVGKEEISRISVSSNGARVMVMLLKMGGGSTFFDIFPKAKAARIAILDADTLSEVASLTVDPKHLFSIRAGINSTGDQVAYIDNGTLKLWSLPASADTQ
jgi:hypothetical protein